MRQCAGVGQETWYAPRAKTMLCPVCQREVPVASDDKRTWIKLHAAKS